MRQAGPTVTLLGRVSDAVVEHTLQTARAVIVTAVEEFGISAVEAQAAGRPVIARGAGGALETVIDGVTGLLARLDDVDSFAAAIERIDALDFDPARAVANAGRFSVAAFERRLSAHVAGVLELAGRALG